MDGGGRPNRAGQGIALTCTFDEDFLATGNGSRRVITANKFNRVHHARFVTVVSSISSSRHELMFM